MGPENEYRPLVFYYFTWGVENAAELWLKGWGVKEIMHLGNVYLYKYTRIS